MAETEGQQGRKVKIGNGLKCPCQGCGDRDATCHARCERYQEYFAECEKIRKRRKETVATFGQRDNGMEKQIRKRLKDQLRGRGR